MTDVSAPATPAGKKLFAGYSVRRVLAWLHLWIGIIFCIPFVALGISGSVLMIGHDLPDKFVADSAAGSYKPVADIIAAAQAVAPEGRIAAAYDAPSGPGDTATVRFVAPRDEGRGPGGPRTGPARAFNGAPPLPQRPGQQVRVSIDPVSLAAKLDQPAFGPGTPQRGFNFMRLMHDLHGRMLIEGGAGRQFVGWLGVLMCGLGLSGIVMWWPRPRQWKAAFKVRFGQSALRVNRELHGAVGIWGLIVFMIVSFSGVYIVFPQTLNGWMGASPAVRDLRNQQPFPVTPIADEMPLDADAAGALAREAVTGGFVRSIVLPIDPAQPYRVTLSREGEYSGAPRTTVVVDPWQKKVIDVRDPAAYASGDKFLAWQRALHTGNGLGIIWWGLVFVIGFLPPLFVTTGITMWLLKRRNKRRVAAQG